MNWLSIAFIYPIGLALVNHIDKYMVDKLFKDRANGTLAIISGLIGLPTFTLIWLFMRPQISLAPLEILILVITGIIYVLSLLPYFSALELDETSVVTPLGQLVPLFGLALGYIVLHEIPTQIQLLGGTLILVGTIILSLEITSLKEFKLKREVFLYMSLFAFMFAINALLFKIVALEGGFWASMFWTYVGVFAAAILLYLSNKEYRTHFNKTIRENSTQVFALNAFNEFLAVVAQGALHLASLLAPLGVVFFFTEGTQPAFVLLFGILITVFLPHISQENLNRKFLTQKVAAIGIMLMGTYLLSN